MQVNASNYSAHSINSYPGQSIAARDDRQGKDSANPTEDQQQQRQIQSLKDRDREVRTHEQAHLAAAGGIAVSGARFSYTTGPDGQRYATGGEVSIDTSEVPGDPQATMLKAETMRRAALAPAQPSGQDYSVAGKAAAIAHKAAMALLRANQSNREVSGSRLDVRA